MVGVMWTLVLVQELINEMFFQFRFMDICKRERHWIVLSHLSLNTGFQEDSGNKQQEDWDRLWGEVTNEVYQVELTRYLN